MRSMSALSRRRKSTSPRQEATNNHTGHEGGRPSAALRSPRRLAFLVLALAGAPGLVMAAAVPASAGSAPAPHATPGITRPAKPHPTTGSRRSQFAFPIEYGISLAVSATTVPTGQQVTVTSTTNVDIGPTPYYAEIFDATTGTLIGSCGFGTSCSATVSSATAATHEYIAYVSDFDGSLPPAGTQATSAASFVTWADSNWQVSLSGPGLTEFGGTYTATANSDVGPTPYFIEIFDATTGTELADCQSGTTCSASFAPGNGGSGNLVAFISSLSSALPPSGTQASSNTLFAVESFIP